MLRLKLGTGLEATIQLAQCNELQISTIRVVSKFLSRKETTWSLGNLNELPRIDKYKENYSKSGPPRDGTRLVRVGSTCTLKV